MVNVNEYRQFRLALLELIGVVVAVSITTHLPTSKINQIGILLIMALHFVAFISLECHQNLRVGAT